MVMGHVVEMEIKNINANNNTKIHKRKFGVQWHITTKCDQDCIHCYIKDEKTYISWAREKEIKKLALKITKSWKHSFFGGK